MFTVHEREKLLLSLAAMIARDRQDRGIKLNYPEALSIISAQILEWAREGKGVNEIMHMGRDVLSKSDVMDGIASMLNSVQIEATFPDGTKLVTVHNPIS